MDTWKLNMPYINNMDYTVPTQAWSWTTLHNRHSILAFNNAWWLFLICLKGHLPIRTSKKTSMQFWFKTEVHLDRTACLYTWMIQIPRSPAICYLVKVFNLSFQNMVGERQTNEVLVSLNFMSFFLTFESLKTKTYVFCWFFRFFSQGENTPRIPDFSCRRNTWSSSPRKDTACPTTDGTIPGGKSIGRKLSGGGINNWNGGIFIGYYGGGGSLG